VYDEVRARIWTNFFEKCLTHTKGLFARQPFLLPQWQKKIVTDLMGTVNEKTGYRQYSTAYIEVPKKNGKTELAAGLALGGLLIDDEPGAEIYSAASTRDQAGLVFRVAAQMVRNDPELNAMCRIVDSTKTIYLKSDRNSFYRAISADVGAQDGINPHMVVYDELHRQKNRDLWDVLSLGSDTRSQPLLVAITTAGISGESPICWDQHEYARQILQGVINDPNFYPVIYAKRDEDEWDFEGEPAKEGKPATGWYASNPALGDFLRIDKVRAAAAKAKLLPSEQNNFRRLRGNEWLGQEMRWLPMHEWNACGAPFNVHDLAGKSCFAGMDLSTTQDITAFVLLFPIGNELFVLPFFWLPKHDIIRRAKKDNVPYDRWAKQGLIELTDGNIIDFDFVRKRINELGEIYNIKEIANDRWNATQITTQLQSDGFTIKPTGQGFASLSAPAKDIERLMMNRSLRHGNNPVLSWMADCCSVDADAAGNIKPVKVNRLKTNKRIDGMSAMITGHASVIAHMPKLGKPIAVWM
jgi:phage terminase large subunit-like protein